jgi:hypothetical protein
MPMQTASCCSMSGKKLTMYAPAIYREQIQQLRVAHSIQDVIEMDEQYLFDTTLEIYRHSGLYRRSLFR